MLTCFQGLYYGTLNIAEKYLQVFLCFWLSEKKSKLKINTLVPRINVS